MNTRDYTIHKINTNATVGEWENSTPDIRKVTPAWVTRRKRNCTTDLGDNNGHTQWRISLVQLERAH